MEPNQRDIGLGMNLGEEGPASMRAIVRFRVDSERYERERIADSLSRLLALDAAELPCALAAELEKLRTAP